MRVPGCAQRLRALLLFFPTKMRVMCCSGGRGEMDVLFYTRRIRLRSVAHQFGKGTFSQSVDSASSLAVYCFFVVDSVCLSVTLFHALLIDSSFLFLHVISPFFDHQFSMWHSTKRCSSIFDLVSLTPKIQSPKFDTKSPLKLACMADTPEMFGANRGFSGMADSMGPYKMLWGLPLLPSQRNVGKFGLFLHKIAYTHRRSLVFRFGGG